MTHYFYLYVGEWWCEYIVLATQPDTDRAEFVAACRSRVTAEALADKLNRGEAL